MGAAVDAPTSDQADTMTAAPIVTTPAPVEDRAEARRLAAAERSRRYRARRAELQGATPKQAEKIAAAESAAAPGARSPAPIPVPVAPTVAELRLAEERLVPALTGAVELVADLLAETQLPKGAPQLGQDRAARIAALWAPILAPNVARGGSAVPVLIAAGATAAPLLAWRAEVRAWSRGGSSDGK
ncbi:MAG: hypothetical protein IT383_20770 [Deltaproteobacteria bacterium]|nr:hypothetical protein [Deltaproteobacteria bacterium]